MRTHTEDPSLAIVDRARAACLALDAALAAGREDMGSPEFRACDRAYNAMLRARPRTLKGLAAWIAEMAAEQRTTDEKGFPGGPFFQGDDHAPFIEKLDRVLRDLVRGAAK